MFNFIHHITKFLSDKYKLPLAPWGEGARRAGEGLFVYLFLSACTNVATDNNVAFTGPFLQYDSLWAHSGSYSEKVEIKYAKGLKVDYREDGIHVFISNPDPKARNSKTEEVVIPSSSGFLPTEEGGGKSDVDNIGVCARGHKRFICTTALQLGNFEVLGMEERIVGMNSLKNVFSPKIKQQLADGNCWMLDNLRLDLGNSTVLNNTTGDNTNASTTTLNYLKNGGGSTSDRYPTAKINNVPWTSSSQNYYSIPMTISTYKDQTTTSYGEGSGKIGVYYNYCAASAGNYCFGNGASAGSPSGNATEDICPKGWRMPTGDDSGEYQALYTAYSSDATSFRNALSTPLSGYFRSDSAHDQGTDGYFWSSTYSNDRSMYRLRVNSSNVHPSNNDDRYRGLSVRCLLGS